MSSDRAIIVKRYDNNEKKIEEPEVVSLAESAGYDVKKILDSTSYEDHEYNISESLLIRAYHAALDLSCSTIIIDNDLDPYQAYNISVYFGLDFYVLDRYQLILERFKQKANTRYGKIQIELAELEYHLPRIEVKERLSKKGEKQGFMGMGEYGQDKTETIKKRISNLKQKISKYKEKNSNRAKKRKQDGYELVSIAGYTNAGKSALLRRLSLNHTYTENKNKHPDLSKTAESESKLFTTLDTTTRKMDMDKRNVLATDTVGFIEGVPENIYNVFDITTDYIRNSDLVLLVVDFSQPVKEIERKLKFNQKILYEEDSPRYIPVLNKTDKVNNVEEKKDKISNLPKDSIAISAKEGINIKKLKKEIHNYLPNLKRGILKLPMKNKSMKTVSKIYDKCHVEREIYNKNKIIIDFKAKQDIVQKIINKHNKPQLNSTIKH